MDNDSSKPSRRAVMQLVPASMGIPLMAQHLGTESNRSEPFEIAIPDATIKRILRRVRETRFPERLDSSDWRYGADWNYMKALTDHWVSAFDWRKAQGNLNRYPQFKARVDDF